MITSLLAAFWFFLPGGIANMTPVFSSRIPWLNRWKTPIDLHQTWHGRRLLGANKTWRGLLTGTLVGGLVCTLQSLITSQELSLSSFLFGALMGFGALVGDAVESFFKRARNLPAGQSWFPFDQIDYIIGGLLFTYPFTRLSLSTIFLVFVTFFGLHLLFTYMGYLLRIREKPI